MRIDEDTLIIAFDGLDYELIKKFNLQNIPQKEFGRLDNQTGMKHTVTSELFASMITGKTYKEHGIIKLRREVGDENEYVDKRKYRKDDLKLETWFDIIDNSAGLFVPSWSTSIFWMSNADMQPLRLNYTAAELTKHYDTREFAHRKNKLMESESIKYYDFFMMHFHRADTYQHVYGDKEYGSYDEGMLEELYKQMDELAGEIIERYSDDFERIIFMSDHGLPAEEEHNENAFYSCNKELFDYNTGENPKITSFFHEFIDREPQEIERFERDKESEEAARQNVQNLFHV